MQTFTTELKLNAVQDMVKTGQHF